MAGHNASASAGGYLYQTDWALVDLLRKGHTRPDQAITLELHDDVAWNEVSDVANVVELLQVKLHGTSKSAGLGDMAVDVWKTIKIWLDRPDRGDPQGPDLVLVTTSVAAEDSAAHALRPATRDIAAATNRLLAAAKSSKNDDTEVARKAFLDLDPAVRGTMLSRARLLDGQMPPEDLNAAVREALTWALPTGGSHAEDSFVSQVWKYWHEVAVDMLAGRRAAVSVTEVRAFIRELRNRYTTENLPTTVELSSITEEHIRLYDGARFVRQLDLVKYSSPALRTAIVDYHRAITQETEWLSNSLLDVYELRKFEAELRFEWEREFTSMIEDLELDALSPEDVEVAKIKAGRGLLRYLLNSTSVSIRTYYNDGFYGRGKRHELAGHDDTLQRIGWHPDFADRLEAITAKI
ncbi:ABC-three component system protein [Amycolatopsis japonica]|uniref:ABC-three component system protein n=1 Tax=Amycolatopsis japonica TaxID=208439 RepID=UPI003806F572